MYSPCPAIACRTYGITVFFEMQMGRGIGALGSDQISRNRKPVKSLKVVLYGEPAPENLF